MMLGLGWCWGWEFCHHEDPLENAKVFKVES